MLKEHQSSTEIRLIQYIYGCKRVRINKILVNTKSRLRNNLITPVNYAHAPSHFGVIQNRTLLNWNLRQLYFFLFCNVIVYHAYNILIVFGYFSKSTILKYMCLCTDLFCYFHKILNVGIGWMNHVNWHAMWCSYTWATHC